MCFKSRSSVRGMRCSKPCLSLPDDGMVLVLSGDVPLTQADTLQELIAMSGGDKLALLTIDFANPAGYGRIVRSGRQSHGHC